MNDYWVWGSSEIKGEDGWYHMVAKDMNGNITNEYHAGVLAHSKDGINWVIDEQPKAYSRKIKWDYGETVVQGQLERPFVLVENGNPLTYFFR